MAVVTGASAGIGAATAEDLVKSGFIVVALARREDRLQQNQSALPANLQYRYHPRKCDVTNEGEVKDTFAWIESNLGGTDVLINNAGIISGGVDLSGLDNTQPVRNTLETNTMSVVYCVREAFNSMKKRNFAGHIMIINSIAGHKVPIMPIM